MNMEMYVSGDFGQQAGVHNCTIIHPQSLKFWVWPPLWLFCLKKERETADCVHVCGGRRLWRILITAQGNRGRLKRIVMLCPCECLCTSVSVCTHRMCIYLCWHAEMHFCEFLSVCVFVSGSLWVPVCVNLPSCTSASICFCICPHCTSVHMTLHGFILGHKSMHSVERICLKLNKLMQDILK